MTSAEEHADVVVVGAGSSGSAAAAFLAESGWRVVLIDARPAAEAGAHWSNGVPPWTFERAGVAVPEPPERLEDARTIRLYSPSSRVGTAVAPSPILNVDMRRLVARLQARALAAGATLRDRTSVRAIECDVRGRPTAVRTVRSGAAGSTTRLGRVTARLFVDASGMAGVVRRAVPLLARDCPEPRAGDCCSAAQFVFPIRDVEAARAFLHAHGAEVGDALCWTGIDGPFSTLGAQVSRDVSQIGILAGAAREVGCASGAELMRRFRQNHPWIGEAFFGGAGLIPLRAPYARLAAPGVALVGDAGCQSFPAHASGVGSGLIAARMLADATAGAADPGAEAALWAYETAFQREIGCIHGPYDVVRRTIQALPVPQVEAMVAQGLVTSGVLGAVLSQRLPFRLPKDEVAAMLRGSAHVPRAAAAVAPWAVRVPLVWAAYRRYPRRPDARSLRAWAHGTARAAGWPADIR